jgi:hypothetical protein
MSSLIEEIQRNAIDRDFPVSDLLRKVKLAAAKLKLEKVEEWVDHELKGYTESVPEYRRVRGVPMVQTLYHGNQPLRLSKDADDWSQVNIHEPVAALEHTISQKAESLMRPYPATIVAKLSDQNEGTVTQAGVRFSTSALVKIVDTVRTLVLEWAIKLERIGVNDEKALSHEDQRKAETASTSVFNFQHIGTFIGNVGGGNISGPIVAAPIAIDRVKSLVSQVGDYNDSLVKQGVDKNDLQRLRSALEQEIKKAKPDQTIISQLLQELSDKLKVAATSVVAQGIISLINQIIGFPG